MDKTKKIPIFPLDLVLFPRQILPLRIFEPRYKQLIEDCISGDGQFGVCLIDSSRRIQGWAAPHAIGTIAKITRCEDTEMGMQYFVDAMGTERFRIFEVFPPRVEIPDNYDPYTYEGHAQIAKLHEKTGMTKMYIAANVKILPEITDDVSNEKWDDLVELWKSKMVYMSLPKIVNPLELEQILNQYCMGDTPTVDHLYSLATLGASHSDQLQPVLEAQSMDDLIFRVEELLQKND